MIQTSHTSLSRRVEIEQWIHANSISSNDLVIIDDDKSLNDLPQSLKERLVLTKPLYRFK
jgi:hypothetical protein